MPSICPLTLSARERIQREEFHTGLPCHLTAIHLKKLPTKKKKVPRRCDFG